MAVIPRDQQRLLEKDDAWVTDRQREQRGLPHIPDSVLQTVKQAFLAKKSQRHEDRDITSSSSGGAESRHARNQVDNSGPGDLNSEVAVSSHHAPSPGSQVSASSQGTAISWNDTPEPSPRRQPVPIQSSVVQETPKVMPEVPRRLSRHLDPQMVSVLEERDDEEEDEMEMALPQGHQLGDGPVNREASRRTITSTPLATVLSQAMDTPPCGQPNQYVIPDSVPMKKASPRQVLKAGEKRRRRMKPIMFEGTTPMKPINPSTSISRMPTTKPLPITVVESSMSASSSSLIPATCATVSTQDSIRAVPTVDPIAVESDGLRMPLQTETSRGLGTVDLIHDAMEELSRKEEKHEEQPSNEQVTAKLQTKQQAAAEPQAAPNPYEEFVSLYPEYTSSYGGTLRNFVKACLCLEYLESERSLRDYLYDDFIRSFSGAYLSYVSGARAGQEPLPAIEWFNMLSGAPVFNKMAITRKTLTGTLETFPEEVARSRKFITGDPGEDQPVKRVDESIDQRQQPHSLDGAMEIDTPTPEKSSPRPAQTQPPAILTQPVAPTSPQLGSDERVLPHTATPTSSAASRVPRASQYFNRLTSFSKPGASRKRSAEEQARLREHFRRRKTSGVMSSAGSRPGST